MDTSIEIPDNVWKLVEIECVGHLRYNDTEIFLLKMIDVFSNWISYIPMKDKSCNAVVSAIILEFKTMKIPLAIRFIHLDSTEADSIISLLERNLSDIFFFEVNEATKLIKLINKKGAPKDFPLNICIEKIHEKGKSVLDSFDSFQRYIRKMKDGKLQLQKTMYVFVGQCSLINEQLQKWYLSVLNKFLELNPNTWVEKMPCFLLSLRSWKPPGSSVAPSSYMFHKDWSIFHPLPHVTPVPQNLPLTKDPNHGSGSEQILKEKHPFQNMVMYDIKKEEEDVDDPDSVRSEEDYKDVSLVKQPTNLSSLKRKFCLKELDIKLQELPADVVTSAKNGRLSILANDDICTCGKKAAFEKKYDTAEFEVYKVNYVGTLKHVSSQHLSLETSRLPEAKVCVPTGVPSMCSHCNKAYLTSDPEFSVHLKCHIVGLPDYHCFLCQKRTTYWNFMLNHLEEHIEVKHKIKEIKNATLKTTVCPVCAKDFLTRKRLEQHLKSGHFGSSSENCKHCGKRVMDNDNPSMRTENNLMKQKYNLCKNTSKEPDIRYPLKCDQCKNTYVCSEMEKLVHIDCHKVSPGSYLRCLYCECKKKFWQNMINHLKTHPLAKKKIEQIEKIIERSKVCQHCQKKFDGIIEMMEHVKADHFENSFYQCEICWKAYKLKHDLVKHKENHIAFYKNCKSETENRSLPEANTKDQKQETMENNKCQSSPKRSCSNSNVESIEKYEVKHAFNCPKCDRILMKEVEFHIHLKSHIPGERGFKCLYCTETRQHWTKMLLHLKDHRVVRKTILEIIRAKKYCRKNTRNKDRKGKIDKVLMNRNQERKESTVKSIECGVQVNQATLDTEFKSFPRDKDMQKRKQEAHEIEMNTEAKKVYDPSKTKPSGSIAGIQVEHSSLMLATLPTAIGETPHSSKTVVVISSDDDDDGDSIKSRSNKKSKKSENTISLKHQTKILGGNIGSEIGESVEAESKQINIFQQENKEKGESQASFKPTNVMSDELQCNKKNLNVVNFEPKKENCDTINQLHCDGKKPSVNLLFECETDERKPPSPSSDDSLTLELKFEVQPEDNLEHHLADSENNVPLSEESTVIKCDSCPYETKDMLNLKLHNRIHEGKSYKCEVCNSSFPLLALKKRHMWCHFKFHKFASRRKIVHFCATVKTRTNVKQELLKINSNHHQ